MLWTGDQKPRYGVSPILISYTVRSSYYVCMYVCILCITRHPHTEQGGVGDAVDAKGGADGADMRRSESKSWTEEVR